MRGFFANFAAMKAIVVLILVLVAASATATNFDDNFSDSTLRVDYVLGADHLKVGVFQHQQSKHAGWAGRRHNLDSLPYLGNGTLRISDPETGSTLYTTSFSTLFQEWLNTPEAAEAVQSFEHSVLAPLPRREADLELTLLDNRHDTIAHTVTRYRPDDILVAQLPTPQATIRKLHQSDTAGEAIDVAILGEGYTAAEAEDFFDRAQQAADEILSYEPFCRYAGRFNFVAVFIPSAQSGVSVPLRGEWLDTPFLSHFSTFYSDRYLTTPRVWRLYDAASAVPFEHLIVLANTDVYGGGGIYNSYTLTTTGHANFRPVVVHEFGHSFGGLADEYFYEGELDDTYPVDVEPWEPNLTTKVDFASKWEHMLGTDPLIGVFEGGGYAAEGVYRPADECRMRNNTYPTFCPVCRAALERLIRFYTE